MSKSQELSGEEKLKRKSRFFIVLMLISALFGVATGFSLAFFDSGDGNIFTGDVTQIKLPAGISLAIAMAFLVGLVLWPLYSFRSVDELIERNNLIGMAAGWFAMIGAYPVWQSLAAGGFTRQPEPFAIFLLGFAVTMVTFIIVKIRAS